MTSKPMAPTADYTPTPALSVIIPSYNRSASVQRAVLSLSRQNYPASQVEVIVALDGSTDDSATALSQMTTPFRLFVVQQPNQGSPAARNRGAALARGEILVFMDDDMEAKPGFLAQHARAHLDRPRCVTLGHFSAEMGESSYFANQLRVWWSDTFLGMRSEGHRFAYTDLMSGNFSLPRLLFESVGGFDERIVRHHDYELGYRLLAAGAEFHLAEAASCIHHERADLRRTLRGKRGEGHDDVWLGRLHPRLRVVLPMRRLRSRVWWPGVILMHLAFRLPCLCDRAASSGEKLLGVLERARRYATWSRLLSSLMVYWYWRGVAQELGSTRALDRFLAAGHEGSEQGNDCAVQLADGIEAAAACLDQAHPRAAVLLFGRRVIGRIPNLPGTEPLAGRHLRPLLWEHYRLTLLAALAETQRTGVIPLNKRLAELAALGMEKWREPEWPV